MLKVQLPLAMIPNHCAVVVTYRPNHFLLGLQNFTEADQQRPAGSMQTDNSRVPVATLNAGPLNTEFSGGKTLTAYFTHGPIETLLTSFV